VAGNFDWGNKLSGSINGKEFLDYLNNCSIIKKDFAPWSK
jgi:hypothetical protein